MLRIARNLALIALLSLPVFAQTNVNNGSSGGVGAVSSVSNSDGTLTISPTTGAVVGSLALGHANTWSGQQTFVAPILGTPASGVLTNTTGYVWNNLANPGGNLSLTMGSNTSTFNYTSNLTAAFGWANTTTATSGTTNFSPQTAWLANYWTGAASAADSWNAYLSLGSGTNAASTLNFVHAGSTGAAQIQVPQLATTGSNGGMLLTEGTCSGAAPVASSDVLCANSTSHTLTVSNNNGTAFSVTQTVASGTAAMNTGAVGSGFCETVVTVSATGVATTDTIKAGFNGDPTAVTGYGVSATGAVLTIYSYPTANNVNFKVCNSTSGSITPSALTLNWTVQR